MLETDLHEELKKKSDLLDSAMSQMRKRGEIFAAARRDYQIELSKCILIERDKSMPVTIIGDVCRGLPAVAELRFDRDIAECLYKAVQEAILVYKLEIRIIESQIQREYGDSRG